MSEWQAKRFYTAVEAVPGEAGWEIHLDGRPVRTPGKSLLAFPTETLAGFARAEWDAQEGVIDPRMMPATRMGNSAIEKVRPQREAVIEHLMGYGETDLLCYRAKTPDALAERQDRVWTPWLDWAATEYEARLSVTTGVLPVVQPDEALARLRSEITPMTEFELTAFHDLVTLPGSLILGLAAARGAASSEALWQTARVDELWQIEQWGADEEAEEVNALRAEAFSNAVRFFMAARDDRKGDRAPHATGQA